MANKNQVTLTFAGDHDRLTKTFDEVGASADTMAGRVDSAGRDMESSFDRAGSGLDTVDEKASRAEAGLRGTMDVMSGMGELAQGNVLRGLTDLGGGVADLAQGLGGILVPAMQRTVGWLAQTRVGILAQAAASKVAAAGTKVWAGVQAIFNAVMALNPVVLITLAIIALVAVIVVAYQRSDTFRKIVQGAFRAIGKVVSWLGDRFAQWWQGVKMIFNLVGDVVSGLIRRFRDNFGRVFGIITAPFRAAFNFVARAWNNTIGRLSSVPSWVPVIGGNSISAPTLPTFHTGGIVPGTAGREMLAVLQAGERVTPAAGAPAPMRLSVEPGEGGTDVEQSVADLLLHLVRTGALNLRVHEGAVVV